MKKEIEKDIDIGMNAFGMPMFSCNHKKEPDMRNICKKCSRKIIRKIIKLLT